ncbi:GNAT family protein [Pseudomonas sp. MH9.3]|uniref:GNAT family N-acetyltransferase n=1 Tax=Pseudomonas sp. MH9.3 TaxID=3048630 RepID=UPI002AC9D3FA|nr:GNAT family protein [Pseudomonas sp. MH9.3]MEB0105536.1 GNAT family protein [Pseudomonas sp. MH9.3]WPX78273.1 GNAT family protein [Pseudomonas sp. MH9.3]WQG59162.1 GNAT family protein [Pseudomonas sp. RTB3]
MVRFSDIPAALLRSTHLQLAAPTIAKAAKRIDLTTARRNTRSINVAERCGFECEAVLSNARIDNAGVVDDTCVYVFKGASR